MATQSAQSRVRIKRTSRKSRTLLDAMFWNHCEEEHGCFMKRRKIESVRAVHRNWTWGTFIGSEKRNSYQSEAINTATQLGRVGKCLMTESLSDRTWLSQLHVLKMKQQATLLSISSLFKPFIHGHLVDSSRTDS